MKPKMQPMNIFSSFEILSQKNKIKKHKADVDGYNSRAFSIVSTVGFFGCLILLFLSLPFIHILKLTFSYCILTLFFGVMLLLAMTVIKKHKKYAVIFYYILMILIMLQSIYMGTAAGITTNATTFILFLLLLPVFIIDRPWRLIVCNILLSVAFCITDLRYKTGELLSLDISNTLVVCLLSILFIIVTVRRNMNNFEYLTEERNKRAEKDQLINSIPVGVAIYEVRGSRAKQIFTNDEFYRLFDDTREARKERMAGNFLTVIHPDDRNDLQAAVKRVIDGEDHIVQMCRSIKGDGTYLPVRFAASVAKRENDLIEVYATYSSIEEEIRSKQESEAKTAFLSRMSHDIRTPMNAIISMAKLGLAEDDIVKIKEYLDYIDHSSDFLLGLINDILDLSKIESGEFALNYAPYDESEFKENIYAIIEPLMKEKNINFVYNTGISFTRIITDKLRFNQIFFNLLSNAAKYTPEGGTVKLYAESIPSENGLHGIRFTISDNGKGMTHEFQKKMFTPFTRDSYNTSEQGTGLGLPIVKSIVDEMSGRITVKSKINCGTEFVVDLFVDVPSATTVKQKELSESVSLDGMRILIAEDNDLNIIVLKRILKSTGCDITVAKDGKECVENFSASEEGAFDAILMDVRMPRMNGIEATKVIRSMKRADACSIPIIAVTADAFTEEQKKTIDAGMNRHLTKPVNPELLFSILREFFIKE